MNVARAPAPSTDALTWARKFLPDYFSDPPCAFHAELMATLQDPARRCTARVAPRGHAKSTCAAFAYPLWCICTLRRKNIVIITHESSLAVQFARDIRQELETNERIQAEYGDLVGPRGRGRTAWRDAHFTTAHGVTVQAKGSGAALRGTRVGPQRPDLIICDDIEKDTHVESPEGRRKLEHWLRRVVMPALAPGGQLLVLGSLIHHDSLLANLCNRQRFPRWDYQVYRAIECEPIPGTDQYRRVALWPGRWPLERLDEERERIGTHAFEQEYQANPIDDSVRTFQLDWLQRYDESELVEHRLINLIAVDPAAGKTAGDYFALWVGSVDTGSGIIYTRRLTLERINVVTQIERIVTAFKEWKPVRIGVETNGYQWALKQFLDDLSRREGLYMPIVALNTTANKTTRIAGSAPFYENGTFRLPPALDPEIERQFLHFPKGEHDDAPDVCAMGIDLAREFRSAGRIECGSRASDSSGAREGW